jgi:hypothetical protein
MDLSYFDKLIKEADSFLNGLDKDTIRLLNDNINRYQRFKKNFKLDKRSFYDYQSSLQYYDTLAKKTKSERKDVFQSIIRNAENELLYTKNNYWHERWREENRENLVEFLDFFENFYEQFSEGLKSFKGQLYENKKEMKILKQTTVGNLKRRLNESKGGFTLGQGFGSETRFKSNVNTNSIYNRKLDKNGGFGLGDGFTQLNEEEMVDFIANIVENMKGKTEYHNLKFVDRIANEKGLFESHAKNIKNIIKNDRTPYQLKLRKYLTENVAEEMSEIYEGYSGLMHESEMMVNEIKKTFNEMKSMKKTTNEAVAMTAEALDVPMEMVQKMVEIQKEAYETQMEGGQSMDITEKMCQVYEAYQNMSEGNMKPVYEELKEMMNPKEDPEEPPYGSLKGEKGYEGFDSDEGDEESQEDYEARQYDAYKRDYEDEERYNPLEEESCMECGDTDEDSYIEVELSSPKDFALLRMLGKGSMPMERPSMGMKGYSMGMKRPSMDDENMYEVPMDYSSNPYKKYKFDTGLSEIPYGKKKISSLEGEESTQGIDKGLYESVFGRKGFKISYCKKYMMIENEIYYVNTGKKVKNRVLVENLIVEGWNWIDYLQAGVSVVSIIFPGIGNGPLFLNGMVYFLRSYFTEGGDAMKAERYWNGILDIASALLPQVIGIVAATWRGAIAAAKTATTAAKVSSTTFRLVSEALQALVTYGGYIVKSILKFVSYGWVKWILGAKRWTAITTGIRAAYEMVKKWLQGIVTRAGAASAKVTEKLGMNAVKLGTKAEILVAKKGFTGFFESVINIASGKNVLRIVSGSEQALLKALKVKVGTKVMINGEKATVKAIGNDYVHILTKNGAQQINTLDFVNTAMKAPWMKSYVMKILAQPSAYKHGSMFLQAFAFGADGSASFDMSKLPAEAYPNLAEALAGINLDVELAGYEGESGEYTVKDEVTAVQTALQSLGKDLGGAGVDGKYGPATKAAINSAEEGIEAEPTTGTITVKTVVNIILALIKADKKAEAKTLAKNGIKDATIKAQVEKLLNSNTPKADMFTQMQNIWNTMSQVSGTASASTEKKSSVTDLVNTMFNRTSTVTEETFSENYKRMFGLTLD